MEPKTFRQIWGPGWVVFFGRSWHLLHRHLGPTRDSLAPDCSAVAFASSWSISFQQPEGSARASHHGPSLASPANSHLIGKAKGSSRCGPTHSDFPAYQACSCFTSFVLPFPPSGKHPPQKSIRPALLIPLELIQEAFSDHLNKIATPHPNTMHFFLCYPCLFSVSPCHHLMYCVVTYLFIVQHLP